MTTPARANDHWTRPEQSKWVGPAAPHTYGMPSRLIADLSIKFRADDETGDSADEPAPAAPEEAFTCVTSGSTVVPRGTIRPRAAETELKSLVLVLITMALPAGAPSERATALDTTALTPPIPSVPNATTRSRSVFLPAAPIVPPSGSLSSLPIV